MKGKPTLWRGRVRWGLEGDPAKPPGHRDPRREARGTLTTTGQVLESNEHLLSGASRTEIQPILARGAPRPSAVTSPVSHQEIRDVRRQFVRRQMPTRPSVRRRGARRPSLGRGMTLPLGDQEPTLSSRRKIPDARRPTGRKPQGSCSHWV